MRPYLLSAALAAGALAAPALVAQQAPTNDAPNPYRTVEGWAKLPEGRTWGSLSAVDVDRDGVHIWVAERCGQNDCVGRDTDPVMKFDRDGNLVKSFGKGLIRSPHGIHVDRDGNIWVTDCACTGAGGGGGRGRGARGAGAEAPPPPPPMTDGHQIFKFSPDGQVLMKLGKPAGDTTQAGDGLWQPNDILVAPNGDIYVAEGHSDAQKTAPARIRKYDRTGKLIATWGTVVDSTTKDQPHSFAQPHALAMDSRGRLFVGDRSYNRIKVFDQTGKLLETWYQFARPSGIWIDQNDVIYVADSESGSVNPPMWAWKRGIRIGNARTGAVTAFIPDPQGTCAARLPAAAPASVAAPAGAPCATSTSAAEGVAVDRAGNIYGAEVGPRALKRYVRQP